MIVAMEIEREQRTSVALAALLSALREWSAEVEDLILRGEAIQKRLINGDDWTEIVQADQPPLVTTVRSAAETLERLSADLRQAEARALYEEGLKMAEIGDVFGLTASRVSRIVRAGGDFSTRRGSQALSDGQTAEDVESMDDKLSRALQLLEQIAGFRKDV